MRKFYSQRNFGSKKISFEIVKDLFLIFFEQLVIKDYLDENFGHQEFDGDVFTGYHYDGKLGNFDEVSPNNIYNFFLRTLKRNNTYPCRNNFGAISEEDFFDVVELVYDLVSKPIIRSESPIEEKILAARGDTNAFDKKFAQKEYVERVNEILNDFGFEMRENGEIWELPQQGMEKLVEEIAKSKKPKNFEDKIQHAIDLFFDKNASLESKKSACNTLSGILENVRKDLTIPDKEENELFQIINNWGIRHQNDKQKKASKEDLEWIFYSLLNTINYFLSLTQK